MTTIEEVLPATPLEPGEEGWWKVWGANPHHIRPGDMVMFADGEVLTVAERYEAKAAPMRVGFTTFDVNPDGQKLTIGALVPIVLLRRGTHNMLAP